MSSRYARYTRRDYREGYRPHIQDAIWAMKIKTEFKKNRDHRAATVIQKWTRGFLTRKFLKFIHRCATVLQKYTRGHLTRKRIAGIIKLRYDEMTTKYYDDAATKIQAAWRGYQDRKKFSYYRFKDWVNQTKKTNELTYEKMKNFYEEEEKRKETEMIKDYETWIEYMAGKLHHLQRTTVRPGIYSRKEGASFSNIESLLNKAKFKGFVTDMRSDRKKVAVKELMKINKDDCTKRITEKKCVQAFKSRNTISKPTL